jgi:RNA polymerase sigma-70 factor (ECF subfamily)
MEARRAHTASEPDLTTRVYETRIREMNEVLSRCLPLFHRRAYRYVGNVADAEDVVQDALMAAFKHLDQFRGQAQMSTWLTRIVTNCARMQLRRRTGQIQLSLDEKFGDEQKYSLSERLADCGPSPEDECRRSELHGHMLGFVTQLSPRLRKTFQLRELDGLSTSETADVLGVADGTVKAQLARARTKLRRLMRRALHAPPRSALTSMALPSVARKEAARIVSC